MIVADYNAYVKKNVVVVGKSVINCRYVGVRNF